MPLFYFRYTYRCALHNTILYYEKFSEMKKNPVKRIYYNNNNEREKNVTWSVYFGKPI